jgi:hypothetical protein
VLLQGRLRLVDLGREPVVGGHHAVLDVLVVALDEVPDCEGALGVEGAHGIGQADLLLENPGESAFLDEDGF